MKLSDTCIKRPVFAIVLSLIIIMIGLSSYHYLELRFFPRFESKSVRVQTSFPGASAQLVESAITNPLESSLSTIPGIKRMVSTSTRGQSQIKLEIKPGQNIDEIANDVRNQVSAAKGDLPDSAKSPTIQVGWSNDGFLNLAVVDPNKSPKAIRDYLQRYVINDLLQVPGMANVQVDGADKYAMRIELNPQAMASRNISAIDVSKALLNNNIEMPAGMIKSKTMDFPVTASTRLKSIAQFKQLPIKSVQGQIVRLGDIASVKLGGASNSKSAMYINGQPGVMLDLYSQADASEIAVSNKVKKALVHIREQLPAGMKVITFFNESNFLKQAIHEVYVTILLAIACVLIAVFLFLGSLRAILIPIATIPICLIGAFAVMYVLGYSINVITLLALVLSIGLVVDDAIVMLENIYRHIESGLDSMAAAFKGSKQIAFAVIGMTLSIVAVYLPVGLIHGHIATIFRQFAFTLAGAVIISGFVALTLSPMMCSRLLSASTLQTGFANWLEHFFEKLAKRYRVALSFALGKRLWIVLTVLVLAIGGGFIFKSLPEQFMPPEDMGFFINILNAPTGSSFDFLKHQADTIDAVLQRQPAIKSTATILSSESGSFNAIFAVLKPYNQRSISAQTLAQQLTTTFHSIPGLNAFVFAPSPFSGGAHQDLQFTLMTSGSYKDLYYTIQKMKKQLASYPGINSINSNMDFNSQQYEITVNRELAASLGVNISAIDNTIATFLGGSTVTYFDMNNYRYDVILQASPHYLTNTSQLAKFYVPNQSGQLIPLVNLIKVTPTLSEQTLPHYNHLRSADISAQLGKGYTLGQAMKYLTQHLPQWLPSGTQFVFRGMAENLQDNSSSMATLFGLALIFIYLILAALFESFVDPLIILLTVPLCIVGALTTLRLTGGSLNVFTDIGLITLVGLVAKHGILITQFINELRQDSKELELTEAILQGASIRLRPILMTTTAMVFGLLPLLFTHGASAASREQIGIVLISGLIIGTFFSLFVVPVVYSYLTKLKRFIK